MDIKFSINIKILGISKGSEHTTEVGGDILNAVPNDARVILPAVVLNKDNLFLDDMSFDEFKAKHQGTVEVAVGAKDLLHLLTVPKEG